MNGVFHDGLLFIVNDEPSLNLEFGRRSLRVSDLFLIARALNISLDEGYRTLKKTVATWAAIARCRGDSHSFLRLRDVIPQHLVLTRSLNALDLHIPAA